MDNEDSILLVHFDGLEMKKDSTTVKAFHRVKNYVKPDQMMLHHRYRDFPEPYMVAARKGFMEHEFISWNETNGVFTIQAPRCNLKCKGCYVDDGINVMANASSVPIEDVMNAFLKEVGKKGVIRLSGGEPFIHDGMVKKFANAVAKNTKIYPYLWIDTNLLGKKKEYESLLETNMEHMGISACFKGLTIEHFKYMTGESLVMYKKQWKNAARLVEICAEWKIDLFFSVPEVLMPSVPMDVQADVQEFMQKQKDLLHENAPLRTTILTWKEYTTNKNDFPEDRFESGMTRDIFVTELINQYGVEKAWLPLHQVKIE